MDSYTVVYEKHQSGYWIATVKEVPGCQTQGRTVFDSLIRIREIISLHREGKALPKLCELSEEPDDWDEEL